MADGDFVDAVRVLQLADVDHGFALAADVDERHLRANRDNPALDGLTLLELPGLLAGRREHRGEIFFRAAASNGVPLADFRGEDYRRGLRCRPYLSRGRRLACFAETPSRPMKSTREIRPKRPESRSGHASANNYAGQLGSQC